MWILLWMGKLSKRSVVDSTLNLMSLFTHSHCPRRDWKLAFLPVLFPHSYLSLPRPSWPNTCLLKPLWWEVPQLCFPLKQPFHLFPAPSPTVHWPKTSLQHCLCPFLPPGSSPENLKTFFTHSEIWFENTAYPTTPIPGMWTQTIC